ncbi:MAG: phosphatidate cytidylyltransferase [Alphaproteobacteria bacterium]|nr:phosphatidate cytidylyltransferase [Alphaproteobacteria bacterium]
MRSTLWLRVLAAAVLIPVTLLFTFLGGWALSAWVALAGLAMSVEWVQIVHKERFGWRFGLHALALASSLALAAIERPNLGWTAILVCALIGAVAAQAREERAIWMIVGIVYVATPCLAFAWIREVRPLGLETVVWLLAVVWTTDSVAYGAGSYLGGPKLAPSVSPKKTWAGAIGALICAAIVSSGFALAIGANVAIVITVGLVLSLLTQMGDLAESALKRTFGVKDMSDLIPGHGGALDRLDGLLFATLGLAGALLVTGVSPLAWGPS